MPTPIDRLQEDIEMIDLTRSSLSPKNERTKPVSFISGSKRITSMIQAKEKREADGAQDHLLVDIVRAPHSVKASKAIQTRVMVDMGVQVDVAEHESVASPSAIQQSVSPPSKAPLVPIQQKNDPVTYDTPTPAPKPQADKSSLLFAQPPTIPRMRRQSPLTVSPARSIRRHVPERINRTIVEVG